MKTTIEKRFWEKVEKTKTCWFWNAYKNEHGYGHFSIGKKKFKAPRMAWELTSGKIPHGLWVLHHCDNPPCVNPTHLFLGTRKDNNSDMKQKGRQARGERNGSAKLNERTVREMRRVYAEGNISLKKLATQFGVTFHPAQRIISGNGWKHVPESKDPNEVQVNSGG